MLTICVGPNGSGKSLWAVTQLIIELRRTKRQIVTSLALDLPRLNEYLQAKYPDEELDVFGRVLVINKSQMGTFWRFRGVARQWGEYGPEPIQLGPFGGEDWQIADGGVCYILDEAQTVFNARNWQKTGDEFVNFQSQHRKLTSDVIAITPASSLLEKQFRVLAGECVALSNLYQKAQGIWKAPRKIVYRVYENCPPLPGEEPMHKGDFKIDAKGIASCYRTQDGVGIVGGQADKGKEAKGIPWYYAFVAAGCGALVLWYGIHLVLKWGGPRVMGSLATSKPGGSSVATNIIQMAGFEALNNLPAKTPSPVGVIEYAGKLTSKDTSKLPKVEELPVAVAWCRAGRLCQVELESGGVISGTNLVLQGRYAFLDGEKFEYQRGRGLATPKSLTK